MGYAECALYSPGIPSHTILGNAQLGVCTYILKKSDDPNCLPASATGHSRSRSESRATLFIDMNQDFSWLWVKTLYPGEPQSRWYMGVPPQNGIGIGSDPWPFPTAQNGPKTGLRAPAQLRRRERLGGQAPGPAWRQGGRGRKDTSRNTTIAHVFFFFFFFRKSGGKKGQDLEKLRKPESKVKSPHKWSRATVDEISLIHAPTPMLLDTLRSAQGWHGSYRNPCLPSSSQIKLDAAIRNSF